MSHYNVNCRRAEDADPAPDPLGDPLGPVRRGDRRRARRDPRHRDLARAGPRRRRRDVQSTEAQIGPYELQDFNLLLHPALRPAARPRSPSWPGTPGATRDAGHWPTDFPEARAARLRPRRRSRAGWRLPASASSASASSSARPCPTARRSPPAARSRRAATGARPPTAPPPPGSTSCAAASHRTPSRASQGPAAGATGITLKAPPALAAFCRDSGRGQGRRSRGRRPFSLDAGPTRRPTWKRRLMKQPLRQRLGAASSSFLPSPSKPEPPVQRGAGASTPPPQRRRAAPAQRARNAPPAGAKPRARSSDRGDHPVLNLPRPRHHCCMPCACVVHKVCI